MANINRFRSAIVAAAAVGPMWSLQGCQETLTQVDARLIAPATRPALDIADYLPRLADLFAPGSGTGETVPVSMGDAGTVVVPDARQAVLARWEESWNFGNSEGGRLRDEIYRSVGPKGLQLDPAAARSAVAAVRAAVTGIESVSGPLPPRLELQLGVARGLLDAAERGGGLGYSTGSALEALRAADALREISPKAVALTVVEKAEAALAAAPDDGYASEPALQSRARRLTTWARSAVSTGDYTRAIQRGYYACRLLGVSIP